VYRAVIAATTQWRCHGGRGRNGSRIIPKLVLRPEARVPPGPRRELIQRLPPHPVTGFGEIRDGKEEEGRREVREKERE